ncbi:MAG: exodeoxyribonuclease VII large subunit [Hyphomicrobiales bacterium]|nr:exodeoxyribonuclease VII large subunit [Hyphomicrobiales bacterium]
MEPESNPATNALEWSVSDLSGALKRTIEDQFGFVRVRGEISGYRGPSASGHVYFSLKDANAKIDAVIWKGVFGRLKTKPQEGLEIIATGKITTFPGKSAYQIIIDQIEPAGLGALMALLEERRRKLATEGLFDEARKQLLPYLPEVIGVITSPTGAVIRDILHRLEDRFPRRVLVWPVRVQGETSGAEVAVAIRGFNALVPGGAIPRPDVLIVARGGGSLEDLMSFNDEAVVRAAAASDIPLISAVGHETDWTLIDYASDLRAPTPTGAAEKVVPVRGELLVTVDDLSRRRAAAIRRLFEQRRQERRLSALSQRLQRRSPQVRLGMARERLAALTQRLIAARQAILREEKKHIGRERERLDQLLMRGRRALASMASQRRASVAASAQLLEALSYTGVLKRGFALVRDAGGSPVRSTASAQSGSALTVEFADGKVAVTVDGGSGPPRPQSRPRPGLPLPGLFD